MIVEYQGVLPKLADNVFIEQTAMVIGDVEIGQSSSIWFYAVVRGDVNYIRIGERTNIQDSSVVHVTYKKWPTHIGSDVTVGHRAVIHGATIGDNCLIGIGSIVLDGAEIGDHSIVGAGALVPPGMKVPPRTLMMGVPAKPVRELTEKDLAMIENQPKQYLRLGKEYGEAQLEIIKQMIPERPKD